MNKIAVIGGSHFASLKNLVITHSTSVQTPYGEPSAPLSYGILEDQEVVYLPRRGSAQSMAPHKVNYLANIWALRDAGVQTVIATAAVGGLGNLELGSLLIPDQIIDYTYGRENTFLGEDMKIHHIAFAEPYSRSLRELIIKKAHAMQYDFFSQATYGIMQGPRLETIAEMQRLMQDGCHCLGMTGMPEAALARELSLDYACIAIVVRKAGESFHLDEAALHQLAMKEKWVEDLVEAIIIDGISAA